MADSPNLPQLLAPNQLVLLDSGQYLACRWFQKGPLALQEIDRLISCPFHITLGTCGESAIRGESKDVRRQPKLQRDQMLKTPYRVSVMVLNRQQHVRSFATLPLAPLA